MQHNNNQSTKINSKKILFKYKKKTLKTHATTFQKIILKKYLKKQKKNEKLSKTMKQQRTKAK